MSHDHRDEDEELLPFEGIEKSSVIQECREFSAVTVKVRKCQAIIVKVLYLVSTGFTLSPNEATEVFFAATKLFQCDNEKLRRFLYILLKELSVSAEQIFVASASLMRDINSGNDMYRANAIRTLRKVTTDASMIGPMERFLKQAVVDKSNAVASAALVTGIHLSHAHFEMVKRWGPEVVEIAKSRVNRVQYHALALLHNLRHNKSDRVSVARFVKLARDGPIRSPLALCLIIKLCAELMQEDWSASADLHQFVSNMTHHSSDIVVFEAVKALASIKGIAVKDIQPAVMGLQLYLNSHKAVMRFAAVRLLNRIASSHPQAVSSCSMELESLIHDNNRAIGTLAITTLLKSGGEFHMERVLGVVQSFMSEVPEDGKMVIIDALKILASKFPDRHITLITFLNDALGEEGSADLKLVIVETLVSLIKSNPSATDLALLRLCEYIEDCEYNAIITRILTVVGEEGPKTSNPAKYIRYINNRIVLDKPAVRAVGVQTLAKFAAALPELRPRLISLLRRASTDVDDDVRDRAVFALKVIQSQDEYVIHSLISNVAVEVIKSRDNIEKAPAAFRDAADVADRAATDLAAAVPADGSARLAPGMSPDLHNLRDRMRKIKELSDLGEPVKSCEPQLLTETDNEYLVAVTKHIYSEFIVFQYKVTNTMEKASLKEVVIQATPDELDVQPMFAIQASEIAPREFQCVYVVVRKAPGSFPTGSITQIISFGIQEIDEEEPMPSEDYPLDSFALNISDYITPLPLPNFDQAWAAAAAEESSVTYALEKIKSLTDAMNEVTDFYGMDIEGDKPSAITTRTHTLRMSGVVALDRPVTMLLAVKFFISADQKTALTLTFRGGNEELRTTLSEALVA